MNPPIRTAVFPVAGLGTRFLPVTKAGPKEMLPIVDKPLIQFAVEEAIAAGVTQLVFVTSASKRAIEDYFDTNFELEARLAQRGKQETLEKVRSLIPQNVSFVYVRQREPRGLGDAVLCAREAVGDQPFAVLLADDIIDCDDRQPCLQKMVQQFQESSSAILGVEKISPEETHKYGIVEMDADHRICSIVEKPKPAVAPSNLAVIGRYILTPRIFTLLASTKQGVGGEIQLTDAIAALLAQEPVYAHLFSGRRYDCGSRMGFLEATITYALRRPELAGRLQVYLQQVVETMSVTP